MCAKNCSSLHIKSRLPTPLFGLQLLQSLDGFVAHLRGAFKTANILLVVSGPGLRERAYKSRMLWRSSWIASSATQWDKSGVAHHLVDMGGQALNKASAFGTILSQQDPHSKPSLAAAASIPPRGLPETATSTRPSGPAVRTAGRGRFRRRDPAGRAGQPGKTPAPHPGKQSSRLGNEIRPRPLRARRHRRSGLEPRCGPRSACTWPPFPRNQQQRPWKAEPPPEEPYPGRSEHRNWETGRRNRPESPRPLLPGGRRPPKSLTTDSSRSRCNRHYLRCVSRGTLFGSPVLPTEISLQI